MHGSSQELEDDPGSFVAIDGSVLARGRDPYFPAWPDVVQLNAFSFALRDTVVDTLRDIAEQCDGVRCDMAMLMMNDVFARTWGPRVGTTPAQDYWPAVIPAVRETHPGFRFIAEAYWDLEWALQQQGFDFCYDKRLYDRLVAGEVGQVRAHLSADRQYQRRLVRFIENHDEPRAAAAFDERRQRVAAVTALTQAGARLVHDGQFDGRKVRLPVFLGRYPAEPADRDLHGFYDTLLTALKDPTFRSGTWELCDCTGWSGNDTTANLVAWCWDGESRWLIVVNLSDTDASGHVRAPWNDLRGATFTLTDPTTNAVFDRTGDDLTDGLYVELAPWSWHLLHVEPGDDVPMEIVRARPSAVPGPTAHPAGVTDRGHVGWIPCRRTASDRSTRLGTRRPLTRRRGGCAGERAHALAGGRGVSPSAGRTKGTGGCCGS